MNDLIDLIYTAWNDPDVTYWLAGGAKCAAAIASVVGGTWTTWKVLKGGRLLMGKALDVFGGAVTGYFAHSPLAAALLKVMDGPAHVSEPAGAVEWDGGVLVTFPVAKPGKPAPPSQIQTHGVDVSLRLSKRERRAVLRKAWDIRQDILDGREREEVADLVAILTLGATQEAEAEAEVLALKRNEPIAAPTLQFPHNLHAVPNRPAPNRKAPTCHPNAP